MVFTFCRSCWHSRNITPQLSLSGSEYSSRFTEGCDQRHNCGYFGLLKFQSTDSTVFTCTRRCSFGSMSERTSFLLVSGNRRCARRFPGRRLCVTESSKGIHGKASCSALSSWRLTTSGSAFANQARRLSVRLLILLMLKVATFTKFPFCLYLRFVA